MSNSGKNALCILSSLLLCGGAQAITDDSANPYQGIVDRNVFGLKPPTPQAKIEDKKTDLPPIILTGITTILGNKRVLMNVQPPGKPVQSFILTEGQRDGEIEVLEIDEKAGSVKVSQSGTIVPLTFEKNGAKLPASVAPPAPGVPTPATQLLGANASLYAPPGGAPPGIRSMPNRQIRTAGVPENSNSGTPNYGGGNAAAGFPASPGFGSAQPQRPVPEISGEEGAINMLAQHVQNTDQGIEMPPLPPPMAELLESPSPQQPTTPNPKTGIVFPPRAPGLPSLPPTP